MSEENLEKSIKYKGKFNPGPIRKILGLDGGMTQVVELTPELKRSAIQTLVNAKEIKLEEVKELGFEIVKHSKYSKGLCRDHGEWYFEDGVRCSHLDHLDGEGSKGRELLSYDKPSNK